jgi:hypothetical protein
MSDTQSSYSQGRRRALRALVALLVLSLGAHFSGEALETNAQVHAQNSAKVLAGESLRKAQAFLWAKQGKDGGWCSETYGLLRTGQLTPPPMPCVAWFEPVTRLMQS